MRVRRLAAMGMAALSGCASLPATVDAARYERISCVELDNDISATAKSISRLAISRGDSTKTNVPNWLFGAKETLAVLNARRSDQIVRLREEQAALFAARDRKCSG